MKNRFLLTIFLLLTVVNSAFAEIPIYCPKEHKLLYYYQKEIIKGEQVKAEDFKPVNDIPQPKEADPMVCPICGAPLNAYEYIFWEKGLKSPVFHYPAVSLLSNKDGNWIWIPYDKPVLEDWEGK